MASRQAWRRLAAGSVLLSNMTCMASSQIAVPSGPTAHRRLAAGVSPRLRAAAPLNPEISARLAAAAANDVGPTPAGNVTLRARPWQERAGAAKSGGGPRSRRAERLLARSQDCFCAAEQQICAVTQAEPRSV